MSRRRGTIARIAQDGRMFGFVRGDGDAVDYFFHASGVSGAKRFAELALGDAVTFVIEPSDRGPRAGSVEAA